MGRRGGSPVVWYSQGLGFFSTSFGSPKVMYRFLTYTLE